jgi:hypothetical protein
MNLPLLSLCFKCSIFSVIALKQLLKPLATSVRSTHFPSFTVP